MTNDNSFDRGFRVASHTMSGLLQIIKQLKIEGRRLQSCRDCSDWDNCDRPERKTILKNACGNYEFYDIYPEFEG